MMCLAETLQEMTTVSANESKQLHRRRSVDGVNGSEVAAITGSGGRHGSTLFLFVRLVNGEGCD